MRGINLRFDTGQYYPKSAPTAHEKARWVTRLEGTFPDIARSATRRAVASACRLLMLPPSMSLLMVTEFPDKRFGAAYDFMCFYLAMPFGRSGSPSNFALFGDAVIVAHRQYGVPRNGLSGHAPMSRMYFADGIFVEIAIPARLTETIGFLARLARGIIGSAEINKDKLKAEGNWQSAQIALGFAIDMYAITITLREHKVAGASIFFRKTFCPKWDRSLWEFWIYNSCGATWSITKPLTKYGAWSRTPKTNYTDALMINGCMREVLVLTYGPFSAVSANRRFLSRGRKQMGNLFNGPLVRLLRVAGRAPFRSERDRTIWISADAARHWAGGLPGQIKKCSVSQPPLIRNYYANLTTRSSLAKSNLPLPKLPPSCGGYGIRNLALRIYALAT